MPVLRLWAASMFAMKSGSSPPCNRMASSIRSSILTVALVMKMSLSCVQKGRCGVAVQLNQIIKQYESALQTSPPQHLGNNPGVPLPLDMALPEAYTRADYCSDPICTLSLQCIPC